jgi:hypothetical protein
MKPVKGRIIGMFAGMFAVVGIAVASMSVYSSLSTLSLVI